MATTVVWSKEALDDIDAIANYIHRDSPFYARYLVESLFDLGGSLVDHPWAGRIVPELNDKQIRERFLYSYRLLYEIQNDKIAILAVIHGRRLLESIEERFD